MGYTHYWKVTAGNEFPAAKWTAFTKDVKAILKHAGVKLAWEYNDPTKPPEVSKARVRVNGVGDLGFETFLFARKPEDFEFCKTAAKPYDPVVCAVLLAADHHFSGTVEVQSDGRWSDWAQGRELYRKATGRDATKPAEVRA